MRYLVTVHQHNDEPIEGEVDELPPPNATFIAIKNPRKRGNRDLEWIDYRTNTLLLSFSSIVSVEIADLKSQQDIITKTGVEVTYNR